MRFLTTSTILFLLIATCGCSSRQTIIGVWETGTGGKMEFKADGVVIDYVRGQPKEGRYEYNPPELNITHDRGTEKTYCTIEGDILKISYGLGQRPKNHKQGTTITYHRK